MHKCSEQICQKAQYKKYKKSSRTKKIDQMLIQTVTDEHNMKSSASYVAS